MKPTIRRVIIALLLATTTVGFASTAPSASHPKIRRVKNPVSGQYIVVYKNEVAEQAVAATTDELARTRGFTSTHRYNKALHGFAAALSADQARKLADDSRIAYIEEDGVMRASDIQSSPPWGLDRLDQRDLPLSQSFDNQNLAGAGVTVYVLDTGIRTTHAQFEGRAFVGADFINDGLNGQDGHGHGTHVAATIGGKDYGVAKGAALCSVRVLDSGGYGQYSQVIAGIDWVTEHRFRPAVANMSLGGGGSSALDQAVQNSIAAGVAYVVAAGNESDDASNYSPARVPEAITVGATDSSDIRASFSNYGARLDVFAPGVSVLSADNASDTATTTLNGTSMASPHAAGLAAIFLQTNPTATPAAVAEALIDSATTNRVVNPGSGSPNRLAFVNTTWSPIMPTAGAITNNGSPTTASSFDLYVRNAVGVRFVYAPSWSNNNGQDDCIWYDGTYDPANNRWMFTISRANHGGDTGDYTTHFYGDDGHGNLTFFGWTQVNTLTTVPCVTSAGSSVSSTTFSVYANDTQNYVGVYFPSWSAKDGANDSVWYDGVYDAVNHRWVATINRFNHNFDTGDYITHVYGDDGNGNLTFLGWTIVNTE